MWFQPLQPRWKVPGWDVLAGSCADAMTRNLCMRHGTGRWLRPGGDRHGYEEALRPVADRRPHAARPAAAAHVQAPARRPTSAASSRRTLGASASLCGPGPGRPAAVTVALARRPYQSDNQVQCTTVFNHPHCRPSVQYQNFFLAALRLNPLRVRTSCALCGACKRVMPQIESADALPTVYLKAIPLKPSSVVSGKRNSRFARRPLPIRLCCVCPLQARCEN